MIEIDTLKLMLEGTLVVTVCLAVFVIGSGVAEQRKGNPKYNPTPYRRRAGDIPKDYIK